MKINTKVLLITGFSFLVLAILTVFLYFSFQLFNSVIEKSQVANQIKINLFEKRLLLDEYLLFGEDRPREQYGVANNNITFLIKSNSYLFAKDFEKKIINILLANVDANQKKFLELAAISNEGVGISDLSSIKKEKENRILAQLMNQSQEANDNANELSISSSQDAVSVRDIMLYLWAGLTVLLLSLVVILWFVWRGVAKTIVKLHHGTEIIGEGNLDYKVGIKKKDEVGQLSRSFDEMVDKIKKANEYSKKLETVLAEKNEFLKARNEELEKSSRLMVGRELKMVELKKEIEDLKKKISDLKL